MTSTPRTTDFQDAALREGLARVGIGRAGSKDCDPTLVARIIAELRAGNVSPVSRAAFFASLYLKGVAPAEESLGAALPAGTMDDPILLVDHLAPDASAEVRARAVELLCGRVLGRADALAVGRFLFGPERGDGARAVIASALRMRHAEAAEYHGLLDAMREVIAAPFAGPAPAGAPVVQMAEPFDGVDHSILMTPVLAGHLRRRGYRVVTLVGRSAGPKFGLNLQDLVETLELPCLRSSADLGTDPGPSGWYARQDDLSRRFDDWVDLRRQTVKRPFMATAEKLLDPFGCDVLMVSAFHHNYSEIMTDVCEAMNVPASIVTFRGVEGGLVPSLARTTVLTLSARRADGGYSRTKITISPQDFGVTPVRDDALDTVDLAANAALLRRHIDQGVSGDDSFDQRATYATMVYDRAFDWIEAARRG